MSQRQVAAAAKHADARLDHRAPRALAFPAAAHTSVRFWEWEIPSYSSISTQFITIQQLSTQINHFHSFIVGIPKPESLLQNRY